MSDLDTLKRLINKGTDPEVDKLNKYFDGKHMPSQIGVSLPPELSALRLVMNFPRAVVNAFDERLQIEGFRLADSAESDKRFWDWWQRNNLDEESSLGHIEALVAKKAYIVIGHNEDDPETPLITVESANSLIVELDPRTRKVKAAVRPYGVVDGQARYATLYLDNWTRFFKREGSQWVSDDEYEDYEHGLGRPPVVPLVNRARLNDREGRSEIADILGITDAACRSLTNLQAAQELLAVPQRYALGVKKEDFIDQNGNDVSAWEAYIGRLFALQNSEAKVGSFAAASLDNFTNTVMFYARLVSASSGVPIRYLGIAGDVNGSSGDSIREDDTKLIKRAERMSSSFSGAWEEAMRIGAELIDGKKDPKLAKLEVIWRNPATPTVSQVADAAVKLYTATNDAEGPLLPREAVWQELGYGPERRRELEGMFKTDPLTLLLNSTRLADENGSRPVLNLDEPPNSAGNTGSSGATGTNPGSTGNSSIR